MSSKIMNDKDKLNTISILTNVLCKLNDQKKVQDNKKMNNKKNNPEIIPAAWKLKITYENRKTVNDEMKKYMVRATLRS